MSPTPAVPNPAEAYDRALRYARDKHLPPEMPRPYPTSQWPPENVRLLEHYYDWLIAGGTAEQPTRTIYLPVAGHVLGLNPVPHAQIHLDSDCEKVMDYVQAKGAGKDWQKACRNGLEKFRRFLRIERGLGEVRKITPFDVAKYTAGLPAWLVSELERYQRIQQKHWRTARLDLNLRGFWSKHGQLWRFFCLERGVQHLSDLKRPHILDYVDNKLAVGASISSVNLQIHLLHGFLLFLQEEGYTVPQSILRIPSLKPPDSLPKYLTDEQIGKLREAIEGSVTNAQNVHQRRQALLDRATFYLLWQGGMRLSEVEDLYLEDLDLQCHRSPYNVPVVFTQDAPGIFTHNVPGAFTHSVPGMFSQDVPPRRDVPTIVSFWLPRRAARRRYDRAKVSVNGHPRTITASASRAIQS